MKYNEGVKCSNRINSLSDRVAIKRKVSLRDVFLTAIAMALLMLQMLAVPTKMHAAVVTGGYMEHQNSIEGMDALNNSNIWAVGTCGQIQYYNGVTWTQQTTPTSRTLMDVAVLDANNVWAVGKGGTILFFNGTTWS